MLNNSSNKFLSPSKTSQGAAGAAGETASTADSSSTSSSKKAKKIAPAGAEGNGGSSSAKAAAAGGGSVLSCQDCGEVVGDAAAAAQHAKQHGHAKFAEVAVAPSAA